MHKISILLALNVHFMEQKNILEINSIKFPFMPNFIRLKLNFILKYIVLHAFGLMDCTSRDYVMCGDFWLATTNEITSYETDLLKSKYN